MSELTTEQIRASYECLGALGEIAYDLCENADISVSCINDLEFDEQKEVIAIWYDEPGADVGAGEGNQVIWDVPVRCFTDARGGELFKKHLEEQRTAELREQEQGLWEHYQYLKKRFEGKETPE